MDIYLSTTTVGLVDRVGVNRISTLHRPLKNSKWGGGFERDYRAIKFGVFGCTHVVIDFTKYYKWCLASF